MDLEYVCLGSWINSTFFKYRFLSFCPPKGLLTMNGMNIEMRYDKLDFIRGLCLIDMVIVHLIIFIPEKYFESFVEMTNFAAEGFFLVSGMMIGLIYFPRFLKARKKVSGILIKRGFQLLGVHIGTIIFFGLLYHILRIVRIDSLGMLLGVGVRIISFEKVYHLTNILYLFFLFFLLAPFIMRAYEKLGWKPVFFGSLMVFILGMFFPHNLFISYPSFPILTWQFVFVSGFILGRSYESWKDKLIPKKWLIPIVLIFIPFFLLRFQQFLGFEYYPIFFDEFFKKFPIRPGLAIYVTILLLFIFQLTTKYWDMIPRWKKNFVSTIGKYSLIGFLTHMILDFIIHKTHEHFGFFPGFFIKMGFIVGEIVFIYLVILIWIRYTQKKHQTSSRHS
jgi:hypothetical protein